jgi:hypothetical protein
MAVTHDVIVIGGSAGAVDPKKKQGQARMIRSMPVNEEGLAKTGSEQ